MHERTRIKICGLTRVQDVQTAMDAGADAIGLVFYPNSPRYVAAEIAAELARVIRPFVSVVGLFVNASAQEVEDITRKVPISLLQFHGDETLEECSAIAKHVNKPFMRAVRVRPDTAQSDLLKCELDYRAASNLFAGLLLDAFVEGYGGSGKVFDWSLIPKELAPRVVLSGGLNMQNVSEAVCQIRPYAIDVSSGVELSKGIKDPAKIRAFIKAAREVDLALSSE